MSSSAQPASAGSTSQNKAKQYEELKSLLDSIGANSNVLEVADDQEEEADALINGIRFDNDNTNGKLVDSDSDTPSPSKKQRVNLETMRNNLKKASQYVVVEGTRVEYDRLWKQFLEFCVEYEVGPTSTHELAAMFDRGEIPADTPTWIALWIMKKCDKIDIETGESRPLKTRPKYGSAEKMRAAISHKFGRDYGREDVWKESLLRPGVFQGNPSLSAVVSQYMVSLKRGNVKDGVVVTSARAIDEATLKLLYEFNMNEDQFPNDKESDPKPIKRTTPGQWQAGRSVRIMLLLLYIISFLCLLRFDEALRIQFDWIELEEAVFRLKISLPYRKTHQTGGIAPFYLYPNHEKPWLCPVTLYAMWLDIVGTARGLVFRKKLGSRFSQLPDEGMSSDSFLNCFRNNLLDINRDPRPFGTHSFRRGGCQYLAMTLRWPLRDICTWGGWAENFDNPTTIFKYLLSYADTPTVAREDYFNPDRKAAVTCPSCGRSCWCS